ncbi:polysaccharide lyase [Belliella sp. DSM 111904]|uniref:Polysaccharide lyase n=1 Tax=Belliella filtrata TaxID=2923435 RepID=A0ABS9UWE3_9BACT|nr:polysaccharide lyase [Belliella filtrata]MCH7408085.1 polysaccharide lyase [Belliella filtrata]
MLTPLKSFIIVVLIFTLIIPFVAYAQYPDIPEELQAKTDSIMAIEEARLEAQFQKVLPIIDAEAKSGRPYVPWAAFPLDLIKADIPAFPGAEGGGMYTPGGRGGKVFVVTSLADNGPGTLREACEAGGARTVVFNVAGIIKLEKPISVRAPYLTIAGQTAPGDGVCIAGETFSIDTHDVIIRHMRFRRGATDVTRRDDALGGDTQGNVMIDHCSISWGLDENLSMYRNMYDAGNGKGRQKLPSSNITIQNSISSEALDVYNHGFGSTIGGYNSTFIRNLWASNISRNPSVGMYGDFTFVNNVLFNYWNRTVDGGDHRSLFNIINNYLKPGPITPEEGAIRYRFLKPESDRSKRDTSVYGKAYVSGNFAEGHPEVSKDNWAGGVQIGSGDIKDYIDYIKVDKPFTMAPLQIMEAQEAYQFVLENAGATIPRRDAVDERIVKQVKTGEVAYEENLESNLGSEYVKRRLPPDSYKKGIIVEISQVGGYPNYEGEPYLDTDGDGIPDAWEIMFGLDPNDPADANKDLNGDGYTNLEKYINGIDPLKVVDWKDLKNNRDTLTDWYKKHGSLIPMR